MSGLRFGRYEILGLLGRGGMADVYLARAEGEKGVAKRLALKRILPHLAARPGFLDMFVVEARIAVDLTHRNIVPVFDFGRVGGAYFLAMEYVEGRDLGAVLARARERNRRLHPALCAHVAAEVAAALDYAHRRGVVHRDVAPRNVLISAEGEVRLGDFGVAHRGDDPSGALRGTLTYMAPEQALGSDVDGRADVFSLGLVLLEALSGARPRESLDPQVALAQARAGRVPPIGGDVPGALASVVQRATRGAAAERYPTARAMVEDLEAFLRESPAPPRRLADELADLFDGRSSAPVGDAPGDLADAEDDPEATYLGGQLSTIGTVAARPPRRARRVALGALLLAAAGLGAWITLRPPADAPPDPPRAAPAPTTTVPAPPRTTEPAVPSSTAPAGPTRTSPHRARAAPAHAARDTGTLDLNADPWARVSIDGKSVGETPVVGLALSAGTHRVRLENPPLGVVRDLVVEIRPGEHHREVVRLRP
jgi:tRNA A-37 threonylcarbamoyl transferase component Bud32